MNRRKIGLATLLLALASAPVSGVTYAIESYYYDFMYPAGAGTGPIELPEGFSKDFVMTFAANPTNIFDIAIHSPDYNRTIDNVNLPPATVEFSVGTGSETTSRVRYEANEYTIGVIQSTDETVYTNDTPEGAQYTLPTTPGDNITFVYTVQLSTTPVNISLQYQDPLTEDLVTLLSISDSDFPTDVLSYIRSPSFQPIDAVYFRLEAYTDAPYSVTPVSFGIPPALVLQANNAVSAATAALAAIAAAVSDADAAVQNLITQITAFPSYMATTVSKASLLSAAQALANNTNVSPPTGTAVNLAYVEDRMDFLGAVPESLSTSDETLTLFAAATDIVTKATAIGNNHSTVQASITALTTMVEEAQDLVDAADAANQAITIALGTLDEAFGVASDAQTAAEAALFDALSLPLALPTRSDLIASARSLIEDDSEEPAIGTTPTLNYITSSRDSFPVPPAVFSSIEDANDAEENANLINTNAEDIVNNNTDVMALITTLSDMIGQAAELADATIDAAANISDALVLLSLAKPTAEIAEANAQSALTEANALPSEGGDDRTALITEAEQLQNNTDDDPPTGTGPDLAFINDSIDTLQAISFSFESLGDAEDATTTAQDIKTRVNSIADALPTTLDLIATLRTNITMLNSVLSLATINGYISDAATAAVTKADIVLLQASDATAYARNVLLDAKNLLPSSYANELRIRAFRQRALINEIDQDIGTTQGLAAAISPPYSTDLDADQAFNAASNYQRSMNLAGQIIGAKQRALDALAEEIEEASHP